MVSIFMFYSTSGGQGILILQIVGGKRVIIVAKRGIWR